MSNKGWINGASRQPAEHRRKRALGDVLNLWHGLVGAVESYLAALWRPWVGYQLLIALTVLLVAQLLKIKLAPHLYA